MNIDERIWKLDRSKECFSRILADQQLECQLPKKVSATGFIVRHAFETFDQSHRKHGPMVFKFGFTSDPEIRFRNPKFGYCHDRHQKWQAMLVLFVSYEPVGPSFLESALIEKYKGYLYQLSHIKHVDLYSFLGVAKTVPRIPLNPLVVHSSSEVHQDAATSVMVAIRCWIVEGHTLLILYINHSDAHPVVPKLFGQDPNHIMCDCNR